MILQEIVFTLRSLWRTKLFTLTALFVFSFGIAATTITFSILDALVLHPATFIDPKSLLTIQAARQNGEFDNSSPAVYDDLCRRTDLFSQLAAERNAIFTVTRVPLPDQLFGQSISANFFDLVSAKPLLGRLFTLADDKPGSLYSHRRDARLFCSSRAALRQHALDDASPDLRAEISSKESRRLNIYARPRPNVNRVAVTKNNSCQRMLDRSIWLVHC